MGDLQIQGQVATQNAKTVGKATKAAPQESVGIAYAKGIWDGFKGYYAEQYEGTKGVGDALVRTGKMIDEGLGQVNDLKNKSFEGINKAITDAVSDGDPNNLTAGEKAWNAFKGGVDIVTNPKTITYGALSGAAIAATGGAVAPLMSAKAAAAAGLAANAAGTITGAGLVGYGAYQTATAKTEDEAKSGGAKIAMGAISLGASAATAKSTLKNAYVTGIETPNHGNIEKMSTIRAMGENIAIAPKAIGQAVGKYTPKPFSTVITAESPELQGATKYISKPNDVQAYRFNPNGTEKEILANNPHVYKTSDGKYAIPNKWNPNEPYIIDPSKEQMIMMYGGDDMAVCNGDIFNGSYVDTAGFKSNGALNYQNPSTLPYGKVVNVTKQAPGGFIDAPLGTRVNTFEGMRTVGMDDVIAMDHAGNPYVTTKANILKRNIVPKNDPQLLLDYDNYVAYQNGTRSFLNASNQELARFRAGGANAPSFESLDNVNGIIVKDGKPYTGFSTQSFSRSPLDVDIYNYIKDGEVIISARYDY